MSSAGQTHESGLLFHVRGGLRHIVSRRRQLTRAESRRTWVGPDEIRWSTRSGFEGDWRSGSALRSHRRGHWFEPSIAHRFRLSPLSVKTLAKHYGPTTF